MVLEESFKEQLDATREEFGLMAADLMNAVEGETEERVEAVEGLARSLEMHLVHLRQETSSATTAQTQVTPQ